MSNDEQGIDPERGTPWKLIGFVVLAVVCVVFVLQNRERSTVDFLFFEFESRQWVNLAVAVLLGVVLDRLFLGWWRRGRRRRAAS